jgi:hypothetical protein
MPAKNSTLKTGKRFNPITKKFYKDFVFETGIEISYETFKSIILTTNELLREYAADEEAGIELYEGLGHLVVTKYKSKKQSIDWVNTKKLGKKVPLLNLHSFGYIHHIKWFKIGVKFKNSYIYKFQPYRLLTRKVASNVLKGKKYFKWENSDFWSSTKTERTFSKFFKKND